MRSLPNMLPSVKFPNFGKVSCFSIFPVFLGKKKGKIWGEKLLDKNGPYIQPTHSHGLSNHGRRPTHSPSDHRLTALTITDSQP